MPNPTPTTAPIVEPTTLVPVYVVAITYGLHPGQVLKAYRKDGHFHGAKPVGAGHSPAFWSPGDFPSHIQDRIAQVLAWRAEG